MKGGKVAGNVSNSAHSSGSGDGGGSAAGHASANSNGLVEIFKQQLVQALDGESRSLLEVFATLKALSTLPITKQDLHDNVDAIILLKRVQKSLKAASGDEKSFVKKIKKLAGKIRARWKEIFNGSVNPRYARSSLTESAQVRSLLCRDERSGGSGGGVRGAGGAAAAGSAAAAAGNGKEKGPSRSRIFSSVTSTQSTEAEDEGVVAPGSSGQLSIAGEEGSIYPPPKGIPGYASAVKTLLNAGTLASHASISGYAGVFKNYTDPTKFESKICLNRCHIYLGVFSSKEEAAAAYTIAASLCEKRDAASDSSLTHPLHFWSTRGHRWGAADSVTAFAAPRQCPLGLLANYLIYAHVRTFR